MRRQRHPRTAPPRRAPSRRGGRQIEAFILTGITNAASEGINRLIKLEARNAFGFRNPINQRLRSRCATWRASQIPETAKTQIRSGPERRMINAGTAQEVLPRVQG